MNLIQSINDFIGLFASTFKKFRLVRAWVYLIILFFLNWLILYGHYKFYSPLFYGIISPWLEINEQYARGFTHYPGQFLLLPYYFGWAKLALGVIWEGMILGAVAWVFYYGKESENITAFKERLIIWFNLTVAWVIFNGLIVLVNVVIPDWFAPYLYTAKRQMAFNYVFMPGLYILILSLFYYSIPLVVINRVNAVAASLSSLKLFFKNPVSTYLLGFVIFSIPVLISIIMNAPRVIVEKFNPVMVFWILLVGLFFDIFVNFFWMGTATAKINSEE